MRKLKTGLIALAVVFLLAGCGSKELTCVSMYDLSRVMTQETENLPEMLYASSADTDAEENFSYVSDMDYDSVAGYFVSYAKEGTADEIVVIAVKNMADVREAEASLEQHAENRKSLYESYDPDQTARVEDALIFTEKQYAVLIIADGAAAVKEAFENGIQ